MNKTLKNHRLDLVIIDLLMINVSLIICLALSNYDFGNFIDIVVALIIASVVWVTVSIIQKIYKWKERVRLEKKLPALLITILSHFSLFLIIQQLVLPDFAKPGILFNYLILLLIVVPALRGLRRLAFKRKDSDFNYIIVGGKSTNIKHIFKSFKFAHGKKAKCLGRFGNTPHSFIENIGGYENLKEFVRNSESLNKILYVYSELSNSEVREIMNLCQVKFIDFEIIPRETDLFPRGVKVEYYDDLPILILKQEPLFRLRNKILKRSFDIIFSTLVILLVFPWLLPIIAILIKLESKGPVFFVQDRSGYEGNSFPCFKFRTMTVNKDSDSVQATKHDNRITKIGSFLRKSSLDEFPQFLNVFLGHMSVVGPRPHMLKHTEDYSKLIDDFMVRHQVKPGITGWAQVNGYRGPTEQLTQMANRVKFDVWYIENWSFFLDIKCIFYTVFNVVKGEDNAF